MSDKNAVKAEPKKLERADIEAIFKRSRFISAMNLEILEVDHAASRFSVRMPMSDNLERGAAGSGQFHGGAIASLIDVVGDFAIGMLVGGGVPTMNLRVDYLRPAMAPYIEGVAVVRKAGRSAAVVDIDILSADGKLVAIGRGTYVPITG
ncbi:MULTISPECIES: PaaI family thioesterase [unclassified Achromobacter]|uniref:PaaI family thioesterase n=1 Tax=unclassified Achromobacter TaxID=2626865 RepID=UPI000B51E2CE|nr:MULTISPECIES: PaaI family thioesterase [unclassified Achromobacter]OWT73494.1 thioesterase [Achromobacter sp. HZ34]OWT79587.1 thioesterase [Achromobacter sp. HZ28]